MKKSEEIFLGVLFCVGVACTASTVIEAIVDLATGKWHKPLAFVVFILVMFLMVRHSVNKDWERNTLEEEYKKKQGEER